MATELETIVVRLVGNVDGLVKSMDTSEKTVKQLTGEVASLQRQIEQTQKAADQFGKAAKSVVQGITTAFGALKAKNFLQSAFSSWSEEQSTVMELESALKANGRAVEETSKSYQDFAQKMQDSTVYSNTYILSLLKQAESFQITGDSAKTAAKESLALAKAVGSGMSAQAMMRLAATVNKGGSFDEVRRFARLIPQLRGITDQAKFMETYQKLVVSGMESINKEAGTGAGMLKRLTEAYGDLEKGFGKIVEQAIKPYLEVSMEVVKWLTLMDDETKVLIVTIAGLTTGVLGLIAAWTALSVVVGALSGPVLVVLAATVAVGAALASWVNSVGGVEKAWNAVKKAALDAWEWLEPTRMMIVSLWNTILEGATYVWETVKQAAIDAFEYIFGNVQTSWDEIQDYVFKGLLYLEFGMRNFGKIVEYVWTRLKLSAVRFFEDLKFFFTDTLPALLNYVKDNWPAIFKAAFTYVVDTCRWAAQTIVDMFLSIDWKGLWKRLEAASIDTAINVVGTMQKAYSLFKQIWRGNSVSEIAVSTILGPKPEEAEDLGKALLDVYNKAIQGIPQSAFEDLPGLNLNQRQKTKAEKELEELAKAQLDNLNSSYKEFEADKLWELALWGGDKNTEEKKAEDESKKTGKDLGAKMVKGAVSEVKKLDAILAGSAEDFSRMADYFDTLRYGAKEKKGGPAEGKFAVTMVGSSADEDQWDGQNELLSKIGSTLERIERQGENRVTIEAVDLA